MQKTHLPIAFVGTFFLFFLTWSCTKIDTTNLGTDLIPTVDNVKTFADTIDIVSTQGYFNDTSRIGKTENNVLGKISSDPLFGKTDAAIFMQVKPTFYPSYYGEAGDTLIGVDSVVLCLAYKGFWGDSSIDQTLQVKRIQDADFRDSFYVTRDVNYQPATGAILGTASVHVSGLAAFQKIGGKAVKTDSVQNQIRIKLSNSFRDELFSQDSSSDFSRNALKNDSLFRRYLNGLSISSVGAGDGLMYINLLDAMTRLEVHLRKRKAGVIDTSFTSLAVSSGATINPSKTSNYIKRDRSGTPSANNSSTTEHYLQTTPGTYVNLSMPGLSNLSNRIVHRAQISVEQIPADPIKDSIFSVPPYMYLDLKDTGNAASPKWKPIYYDLNPSLSYDPDYKTGYFYPSGEVIDYNYFGGFVRSKIGAFGQRVHYYEFNITRYVQQLVTRHTPNYDMRMFPAYNFIYSQYATAAIPVGYITYDNPLAYGRIKVGSGSNPNYKMRLIIIYSKL
ncbi:MAG: hypothetical protein JWQ27_118 [Ferruginibacter sp.]|nr:hypothetical protein [Ferruginibacter sp.]